MSQCAETPRYLCALSGAIGVTQTIERATPILHASGGCGASLFFGQAYGSGYQSYGYTRGLATPSTNILEKHVVFGGEDRLREQIKATLELVDADLYFVLTGCQVGLIGDDVKAIVSEFKDNRHLVAVAETPGFAGNSYKGYDLALQALIEQVVQPNGRKKTAKRKSVNIFGIVPGQDPFWFGNAREIVSILNQLGVDVVWTGSGDAVQSITQAAYADLNLVLSAHAGVDSAILFEEKYDVPWFRYPLPIGLETSTFIRVLGQKLGLKKSVVDKVIEDGERRFFVQLDRISDLYTGLNFQVESVIATDSTYAISLTRFLSNDFGLIPTLVVVTDDPPLHQYKPIEAQILEKLPPRIKPTVIFEVDTNKIAREIIKFRPTQLFGSIYDLPAAEEIGAPLLTVTYPVTDRVILHKGYAGYEGAVNLIEDLTTLQVKGLLAG